MRKLLSSGLMVFAGIVSTPAHVSKNQTHAARPPSDQRKDSRLEVLRRFFGKADCPARKYSQAFIEVADNNDLDWRLLPSISYVESTGGKAAKNNNFFGWDSGRAEFATPLAGIRTVADRLAHSRLYKNKDLDELLATYNPNAEYAEKVKSIMRRISPSE